MISVEARSYPTVVATAFGRVFYGAQGRLYFSQVLIDDFSHVGRCYQRNDPVAEDLSDIIDTDGGEILIQDAGNIVNIEPFRSGVLVFCDNGIWFVTGTSDTGFTATSYAVNKISPLVLYAKRSVQAGKNIVLFATKDGCYAVTEDSPGSPVVASITENRISSYWEQFVSVNLFTVYDEVQNSFSMINPDQDGAVLVYSMKLNAWYPWKISGQSDTETHALVGAVYNDTTAKVQYITNTDGVIQLSSQVPGLLTDYGNTYRSFITTQPETLKNYTRKKGTPLVRVFMNRTEQQVTGYASSQYVMSSPSSCKMSVRFDWDPQKSTTPREVYRPLPRGFIANSIPQDLSNLPEVVVFEDKIRGSGRSMEFTFESNGNNRMEILGYAVNYSMR